MKIPEESLDDFVVNPAPEVINEPPTPVWLRSTGEVEVLKPLALREIPARTAPLRPAVYGLSWFHRSLALGGVAALIALIFASAIVIGINDPLADMGGGLADTFDDAVELTLNEEVETPVHAPLPIDEPLTSNTFSIASSQLKVDGRYGIRSNATRHSTKPRWKSATYRPQRPTETQHVVSQFVATTLVIFLENGEIKTRIEPQPVTSYHKPTTLSN